ncbi:hypothetical protein HND25_09135 [Rhodococcus erythropolis]|uniref:hypothetical protein n=1 Tax=Rhodococcus erythropolis TaxID=1833 RepID=UPI000ADC0521|nr:hypothetical protein [Rhodococcus erythropolis]MBO8147531.1 hypothetical protein [Rhodococcus erythropolis]MDO1488783.1 hypothetical protein [Rhodococcus erythropolis]
MCIRARRLTGHCTHYDAVAFGGGTPTSLDASGLDRLCDIAELLMGADLSSVLV